MAPQRAAAKSAAGLHDKDEIRRLLNSEVEREVGRKRAALQRKACSTAAEGVRGIRGPRLSASLRGDDLGRTTRSEDWDGDRARSLTPMRNQREACRFHQRDPMVWVATPENMLLTPRGSIEHSRTRSLTPEPKQSWRVAIPVAAPGGAAGAPSSARRRYDTPGGLQGSLGRARAVTPDYHRRYSGNTAGTSLPGSGCATVATVETREATEAAGRRPEPSPRGPRQATAFDPRGSPLTACREVKAACRYYTFEQRPVGLAKPRPQSLCLSSGGGGGTAAAAAAVRAGRASAEKGRAEGAHQGGA